METVITEGDYIIEGGAWFTIKGFSIKIQETDDGIIVHTYALGKEDELPICANQFFDSEA